MATTARDRRRWFGGLAGCALLLALSTVAMGDEGAGAGGDAGKGEVAARFTQIVLSDSGGFTGKGTGKWLSIDGHGKLQAKDRKGTVIEYQLSEQELADLAGVVAGVDWSKVQKQYRSRGADMIQNDLVVTIDGKAHQTHADETADVPPALKKLLSHLAKLHKKAMAAGK